MALAVGAAFFLAGALALTAGATAFSATGLGAALVTAFATAFFSTGATAALVAAGLATEGLAAATGFAVGLALTAGTAFSGAVAAGFLVVAIWVTPLGDVCRKFTLWSSRFHFILITIKRNGT
jgi:hypothetical protein